MLANKQTKWVCSNEDWYPTLPGYHTSANPDYINPRSTPAVRVSLLQLSNGQWRVCVWGGDDFGMELDVEPNQEAVARLVYDFIEDFTSKERLRSWGFQRA